LWECKLVQPLWETIWRLLKNLNIDLSYDPAIPLLVIYPKECDSGYYKGTCTPMFIAPLFTKDKLWKQPRCPTADEWIKKMWYLHIVESYLAIKKYEILSSARKWMELENIILSEFRQPQRPKIICSLSCKNAHGRNREREGNIKLKVVDVLTVVKQIFSS
jgi:hypothetical protein